MLFAINVIPTLFSLKIFVKRIKKTKKKVLKTKRRQVPADITLPSGKREKPEEKRERKPRGQKKGGIRERGLGEGQRMRRKENEKTRIKGKVVEIKVNRFVM